MVEYQKKGGEGMPNIHYQNEVITYNHVYSKEPKQKSFIYHHHDVYEILIVLKGSAVHLVEGNYYRLSQYSLFFVRDNEFHQLFPDLDKPYERVVLAISKEFFKKYGCEKYREIFENRKIGEGNLIKTERLLKSGILDCVERMEKYIESSEDFVVNNAVVEFLYLLNSAGSSKMNPETNKTEIKPVIDYINENYMHSISLDDLSEEFFVSKPHLCRKFKKTTGMTVNEYITHKRFLNIGYLCEKGYTISEAAVMSGYNSYANFYKAYVKEMGVSPKEGLKTARSN